MVEIKYDVRRGADTYRSIYHSRLRSWILKGIIKEGEALVWRSGLSGWRKPEHLEELRPYFEQREERFLRRKREGARLLPFLKKQIRNILIVDDEEDLCWLLSSVLENKGYNVSTANTVSDGLACLKEGPDLVFLDLKLPDGNGMGVLHKIKRIIPQALVVIISAYGSEERREEAEMRGAHSFLDKPFSEQNVMEIIGQFQE